VEISPRRSVGPCILVKKMSESNKEGFDHPWGLFYVQLAILSSLELCMRLPSVDLVEDTKELLVTTSKLLQKIIEGEEITINDVESLSILFQKHS